MTVERDTAASRTPPGHAQAILPRGMRPPPANALSSSLTFAWRALLKIKHGPSQLFDVTVFPILMAVLFTYLFGGALAGSTSEYLQSLLPGILVITVMMITIYTGMNLNVDIGKGMFDRVASLPVWKPAVLVGALLGDALRYTVASAVVVGVGVAMGFRPAAGALGVLLAVALLIVFSTSLAWVWTLVSLLVRTPETVSAVSNGVLFPVAFASNVFVDPRTMPGWLQVVVEVNPVSHLVEASRGLMHGTAAAGEILWVLVASGVLVLVFAPITMVIYRRR
jgi:ABC-2 type transport system permease protein